MNWIGAILGITVTAVAAQTTPSKKEDTYKIGVPSVPESTNQIDIFIDGYMKGVASDKLGYYGKFRILSDTGLELQANSAIMDLTRKKVDLNGDLSIYQGGIFQRGDSASFDLRTHQVRTQGLKVSMDPILLEAGSFYTAIDENGSTYFVGENAAITTHDYSDPNFWMRASKIRVFPDDRITFKNLRVYAGDTPVFWLPYLSQPLDAELGYHFVPGARSNWGAYLLNRYGFMVGGNNSHPYLLSDGQPWLQAQALLDIRTRRGLGVGLELKDTRLNNPNLTGFRYYYINDLDPQVSRTGLGRSSINEDRYRIELKHRYHFLKELNNEIYADFNLTKLSDRHFREDFEPRIYRYDPEPENSFNLLHRKSQYLLGLTGQFRVNSFYTSDTRLPELFIDRIKSPLLDTPFLYEAHASIGKYKEYLGRVEEDSLTNELASLSMGDPRIDEINALLDDRGFNRFHTTHSLTLPLNMRRGIGLAPYVTAGYTRYWGIDNGTAKFDRTHFEAGIDFSMKFSKKFSSIKSKKWGVDGLMHVIEPYSTISHLKTDALDPSFRAIDQLTPTTNLRPIKVGRFSAVDDLNEWSILRLGMRNNLITRRNGGSHSWLSLDSYIDVFLEDPEFDRDFSNLYNHLRWRPLPWVSLDLEAQFPIANSGSGFSEYSSSVTFMPKANTELTVGYRYLNSHPTLEDSSRIHLRAYTRLNEKWGLSFYQQWEMDDGTLENQQYSVHRDLGSWSAALGVTQHDNRIKSELGVMLSFTLKEFPSLSIPLSLDTE